MKRVRSLLGAAALIVLPLALAACTHSNGATGGGGPAAAANGQLTVLVTGTTWGNLEPCG
jgi:hypothetical protein